MQQILTKSQNHFVANNLIGQYEHFDHKEEVGGQPFHNNAYDNRILF